MRTITFDRVIEKKYIQEVFKKDLKYMRLTLLLCIAFYALFGIMDYYIIEPHFNVFFVIRFFIVIPFFVAALVLSFTKYFSAINQVIMTTSYVVAGVGIVAMLILAPSDFSYYGGLFLIFAVGHFITRIYWIYVSIGSVYILSSYILMTIFLKRDVSEAITYLVFYLGFIIICIYASYTSESYRRENFIRNYELKDNNVSLEKEVYDRLIDLENSNQITIISLASLAESRDKFTGDHIERVGRLCHKMAKALPKEYYYGYKIDKEDFIKNIRYASTLHDIGKVSVPEHILMKPGKLTHEEMEIMKAHTTYGYKTLRRIQNNYSKNDFINMGVDICRYHHERWNGQGYPTGLDSENIPLSARIVSIVDVFDALRSERPYKKKFSIEKSLSIIEEEKGEMFDPYLVDVFLSVVDD